MNKTLRTCKSCNKEFIPSSRHISCPMCRHEMRKKQCPSCDSMIQSVSKTCVKCFNKIVKEYEYKEIKHSQGYMQIKTKGHNKNNGYKFVHIIIMEEHLGRSLLPDENVHHINGVRDDNRIENLELWTRPQPVGIRTADALEWAKEIVLLYEKDYSSRQNTPQKQVDKNVKLTERKVTSRYNKKGYIMCYWKDEYGKERGTFEHVIVMSEHIGRDLLPHENVHHINGVKDDNRIENLELWTKPQPSGIRAKDALKWANEILSLYK